MQGRVDFIVGLQFGDEGKGKIVDLMAATRDAVIRGNGGSNAGHTIVLANGKKLALHQLPSGVAYPDKFNILGHGEFLDPVRLIEEMADARGKGVELSPKNIAISSMCHLVLPIHKAYDAKREAGKNSQGSTKAGIAYVASDKVLREGVRSEIIISKSEKELMEIAHEGLAEVLGSKADAEKQARDFAKAAISLKPYLTDTVALLHGLVASGKHILAEGAQAFGLDINHGKYPYTTSSDTTVPGLLVGTGANHTQVGQVIGVVKATPSKVGGGNFVTKITDEAVATSIRGKKGDVDGEYGATTGREREVGYLDLVALRRAVWINGISAIAITKFDHLMRHGAVTRVATAYELHGAPIDIPPVSHEELSRCKPIYKEFETWGDISHMKNYAELPDKAKDYIKFITDFLEIPVTLVGTGPERDQVIKIV
jgi:adenylosuccinate synthase